MFILGTLESNCPKCDEPVTIFNPTPGATGHCKECLSCDWYVVSEPVIQDGVMLGLRRPIVKWRHSSKADIADRKERVGIPSKPKASRPGAPKKYPHAMEMALDLLAKGEDKDITIYRKCKEAFGAEERIPKPESFMRAVRRVAEQRRREA
jgi:hypothetical protein